MHSTKGKEMHLAESTINPRRPELRTVDGLGEHVGSCPAVEVSQLRKTYPGGVEAVEGDRFRGRSGRGVRAARPERRRQVDHDRHAHDHDRPDRRGTARLAGYDVATQTRSRASVSSVVFQEAVVDGALSGRAQPRAARPPVGRRPPARAVADRRADRRRSGLSRAARPAGRELQRRPAPPARDRAGAGVGAEGAVPR